MKWLAMAMLCVTLLLAPVAAGQATDTTASTFTSVEVVVDAGERQLAAWQVEVVVTSGAVQIVGVEGGDHRHVYRDPPYYDPEALAGGRIIVASFTTGAAPAGKVHVATLHLRVAGEWALEAKPMAAADGEGKEIRVTAAIAPGAQSGERRPE